MNEAVGIFSDLELGGQGDFRARQLWIAQANPLADGCRKIC